MWRDFYPGFILSKVKSREDIKVAKEGRRSATKATEIIADNKRCKKIGLAQTLTLNCYTKIE